MKRGDSSLAHLFCAAVPRAVTGYDVIILFGLGAYR